MTNLWAELNRRNVTRVAIAYAVAGWLLTEVASVVLPTFNAPEWVLRVWITLLVMGFPLAVIFSWVYELTPEGLKRESEVDRNRSIAGETARKLNVVVIVLLLIAIGLFTADRFLPGRPAEPAAESMVTPESGISRDAQPSVAVLAFENMSPDADNEYFADGISEEILNLLSDVSGLSVASRTSAFAFKGKGVPIPEIAETLGVRYVLEGSVRKAGDQVRVTAQLIDAKTDRHLWSDAYDRALEGIFTIQDEIAAAIGRALEVQLLGEGGTRIRSEAIDAEVYAQFLEARYLLRRRNTEDMRAANEILIGVVSAEPTFARGHAVLGEAYLLLNRLDGALVPENMALALARMHAEIAASLNPDLAGIDLILGNLAEESGDLVSAIAHFDRAVALEPQEPRPYHWRGLLLGQVGYLNACRSDLQTALQLDPDNPNVHFALAACLLAGDDFAGARALAERGSTLGNPRGYGLVVQAEMLGDDPAAAARAARRHIAEKGADPEIWGLLLREIDGEAASGNTQGDFGSIDFSDEMGVLLMLGETDRFFSLLEDRGRLVNALTLVWASPLTAIRREPRFVPGLERLGALDLWRQRGAPADCRANGDSFICGLAPGN